MLLMLVGAAGALTTKAATEQKTSPPPEESDRFLRTPFAMEGLTFSLDGREGWVLTDVVLGVRKGRLIVASFTSQTPDGAIGAIEDKGYSMAVVEDTTSLPGPIFQIVGGETYEVRGFTFGRTAGGKGYVDWAHLVSPEGLSVIAFFDPPPEPSDLILIPQCRVFSRFQCLGFCSGSCVVDGSDPCDCDEFGFCFIDFQVISCLQLGCEGKCLLFGTTSCGCIVGATEDSTRECN